MPIIRFAVGAAILIALIYAGFYVAQNGDISFLGFGSESSGKAGDHPRPLDVLLSAVATLIGLFFGALHQQLNGRTGAVQIVVELKAAVTSAPFFRSLLVAPLVFSGVYAMSGTQPDLIIAMLFAFQNGFFCEAIFRQKHARR